MPLSNTFTFDTSLAPIPPAPPDTPRTFAFVAPATPAGVTADATAYSTLAEMEDDGWDTGDVAYNAMAKLIAQTPVDRAVSAVVVIKRATPVANVWTIDIISTTDGNHTITVDGTLAATFAASGSTTTQIKDGLVSAFNLGAFASTITAVSTDADTLSLTADVAGIPFTPTSAAPGGTAPVVTQTVANVGIYADLGTAFALLPFWGVYCPGALEVEYKEAIRWAQADITTRRNFVFQDSTAVALYDSGDTSNIAVEYATAGHTRVNLLSHPTATDYAQAMAIGRLGGGFPGKRAWHYAELTGSLEVTVTPNRTVAQVNTLSSRFTSRSERYFGPSSPLLLLAEDPNIPSEAYIFQRHAEDWWWYTMVLAVDAMMRSNAGVDLIEAGLQGAVDGLSQAMIPLVTEGVIADDFTFTFTDLALIPAGEKARGDFKTTGRLLASATVTPKLRSLRVSAQFAV
jgi:hypothetical protein